MPEREYVDTTEESICTPVLESLGHRRIIGQTFRYVEKNVIDAEMMKLQCFLGQGGKSDYKVSERSTSALKPKVRELYFQ